VAHIINCLEVAKNKKFILSSCGCAVLCFGQQISPTHWRLSTKTGDSCLARLAT